MIYIILAFFMAYSQTLFASYALSIGEQDHERLIILNELHNASSLDELDIKSGMRVLTIGCGIGILELEIAKKVGSKGLVIATDISLEQLSIAEQYKNSENFSQISFLSVDVSDIEQIPGQFDRIHCRLVLTHLPLDRVFEILPVLYRKISPGGFLLLEEVATIDSLYCIPSHLGYEKWKIGVQKQFFLQKSDHSPGKKIFKYFLDNGYTVSCSSYQPILSNSREKSILSLGVHSASKRILQQQLMTLEEVDEILFYLHQLEGDTNYLPRYNEIIQIKVRKL